MKSAMEKLNCCGYKVVGYNQKNMKLKDIKKVIERDGIDDALIRLLRAIESLNHVGSLQKRELLELVAEYKSLSASGVRPNNKGADYYLQVNMIVNQIIHKIIEIFAMSENKNRNMLLSDTVPAESKLDGEVYEKIRIAFLSANPIGTKHLRQLEIEMRSIKRELLSSGGEKIYDLQVFPAATIKDLQEILLNYRPNLLHFSGHGSPNGIILWDDDLNNRRTIKSEALSNLFKLFSNEIACVFLNSCYSESQAKAIREHIPSVIGMSSKIQDKVAAEFSVAFYKSLSAGRSIQFSYNFAKLSLNLYDLPDSDIPKII